ncbi:L-proline amide hydrolase [Murinocardiopsis flavida]|uniref:Proline iminopeptidase n=1 Tax=Murinocardiopsis flavida TaxID=645275 RepID=A0A2P8C888_9ACTN|nr:proline iminopeptidase-family hydrolase [Murinocardiopsis flavida]PSK81162.1 L-proline amide hydrolase [Murinocardiopsis flavida]
MSRSPVTKGTLPFRQYSVWYRLTGTLAGDRPALVVLHGGPGSTHDYLIRLARLADDGWPVIHYDQLGNGASTHVPDAEPGFWTPQLFLDELDTVLGHFGVGSNYVLFGQSWGGLLAAEHAARRPAGLRGLVVANAPASYPQWLKELAVLRDRLPPGVNSTLLSHERAGTTDSREYFEAMMVFYRRHLCRLDPWPSEFTSTFMEIYSNPNVYQTMNGPSEFHVIGSLKDWGVVDSISAINVPTLLISGVHDEVTLESMRPYHDRIPDTRWEVLEDSSHTPHLEEPEKFDAALIEFLKSLD